MDTINKLLDNAREVCKPSNDAELSRQLKVGRSGVSNWRHGRALPDAVACAEIARMTGQPLARVLGIVGEARAISQEEKRVWRRLANAAITLAIVVGILAPGAMPSSARAAETRPNYTLCEVRRRLWRFLAGLPGPRPLRFA